MKKLSIRFLGIQIVIIGVLFLLPAQFQSCKPVDPDDCDTCITVYKPNIYLYPTSSIPLKAYLIFPLGGKIITSIPSYGNGWDVTVDTTGLINNQFQYLFYESTQPDVWQTNVGWTVRKSELRSLFTNDLHNHGFKSREIEDFTEYWIPRLTDSEYYIIYPQEIDVIEKVINLDFSVQPDNILRLFYLVEKTDNMVNNKITAPDSILPVSRTGFNIAEWGVILK